MEWTINTYISNDLVTNPELLPIKNDTNLLDTGILDSLSMLRLVFFLEERFRVKIGAEELIPDNFATIDDICDLIHIKTRK